MRISVKTTFPVVDFLVGDSKFELLAFITFNEDR